MQLISVRALTIFLSVILIVCTAVVCLSLSLSTADTAVTKTEDSGQRGIDRAFVSADSGVRAVTEGYLNELANNVYKYTISVLQAQSSVVDLLYNTVSPLTTRTSASDGIEVFDFYLLREKFRVAAALAPLFNCAAVSIYTQNRIWLAVLQSLKSLGSATPVYMGNFLNSTQTTPLVTPVDYEMESVTVPNFKCNRETQCKHVPGIIISSYDPFDPRFSLLQYPLPDGQRVWSPMRGSGSFVGIARFILLHSSLVPPHPTYGTRVAAISVFVDLTVITDFMTSLDLPSGSRVFGVSAEGSDQGILVGASHGGEKKPTGTFNDLGVANFAPVHCTESNDTVVVGVCEWALRQPGQLVGLHTNRTYEIAPLNHTDDMYFVRALEIADTGLHCIVFAVVPRAAVLGAVDAEAAETHRTIQSERDTATKDTENMYMIMYITLGALGLVLMCVAVFFTLVVTRPMLTLQREMAAVAYMELEAVDMERPASALEEVGSMQASFLRMCQNMKEYRDYLPASILAMMRGDASVVDEDGEDDDDEGDMSVNNPLAHSKVDSIARSTSSMSSSHKSSDSPLVPIKVDLATVVKRPISVLVVNVRHTHTLHFPNLAKHSVPVSGSSVKTTSSSNMKMRTRAARRRQEGKRSDTAGDCRVPPSQRARLAWWRIDGSGLTVQTHVTVDCDLRDFKLLRNIGLRNAVFVS